MTWPNDFDYKVRKLKSDSSYVVLNIHVCRLIAISIVRTNDIVMDANLENGEYSLASRTYLDSRVNMVVLD